MINFMYSKEPFGVYRKFHERREIQKSVHIFSEGINVAEAKAIYQNVNGNIDTWTKAFYFFVVQFTFIGLLLPYMLLTVILYKSSEDLSKNDAFRLPFSRL